MRTQPQAASWDQRKWPEGIPRRDMENWPFNRVAPASVSPWEAKAAGPSWGHELGGGWVPLGRVFPDWSEFPALSFSKFGGARQPAFPSRPQLPPLCAGCQRGLPLWGAVPRAPTSCLERKSSSSSWAGSFRVFLRAVFGSQAVERSASSGCSPSIPPIPHTPLPFLLGHL